MAIPVLAGVVMKIAAPLIVQKLAGKVSKKEADDIAAQTVQEIVTQVTADPVVKNAISAEPWYQSRVALGSIVAAVGVLLPTVLGLFGIKADEGDILRHLDAVLTLAGALYALYGRLSSGLKPLFSRK